MQSVYSLVILLIIACNIHAFAPSSMMPKNAVRVQAETAFSVLHATESETDTPSTEEKKLSLEEKMAGWEASDEEIKAASLGGMTPGKADGFDIGLYIAFPIIVATSLFFAVFPFIMDKIDVSSVGPPPTV